MYNLIFRLLGWSLKGTQKLKLAPLKSSSIMEDKFTFEIESHRLVPFIEYKFMTREPCVDLEYETKTKDVFKIVKLYPEFKITQNINIPGSSAAVSTEVRKSNPSPSEAKQKTGEPSMSKSTSSNQKKTVPQTKAGSPGNSVAIKKPTQHVDKSNFCDEELEDPDYPDGLNSVTVLESKINILNDKIAKIEGRTPKELRLKLISMNSRKKFLEQELGNSIDVESYGMMIENQLNHFMLLYNYFLQEGLTEKANITKSTVSCLIKEKKELATMKK